MFRLLHRLWLDNMSVPRYVVDTNKVAVRAGRRLVHKDDADTVLPAAIVYRRVSRYKCCVSCTVSQPFLAIDRIGNCFVSPPSNYFSKSII